MARLRPLGNTLVIAPLAQTSQHSGSLALPQKHHRPVQQWRVLEVGPGRRLKDGSRQPLPVQKGDTVLTAGAFENLHVWDDGVQLVNASQVLAVIERTQ